MSKTLPKTGALSPEDVTAQAQSHGKCDFSTLVGFCVATACLYAGSVLHGLSLSDVLQPAPFIIVFSMTLGSVLISSPVAALNYSLKKFGLLIWFSPSREHQQLLLLSAAVSNSDPSLALLHIAQHVLPSNYHSVRDRCSVNGQLDSSALSNSLLFFLRARREQSLIVARLFEIAGASAPTGGVLGAVCGLVDMLRHLREPTHVGHAIASAFLATIYGLVTANLVFLPAAQKLRMRTDCDSEIVERVVTRLGIQLENQTPDLATEADGHRLLSPSLKKTNIRERIPCLIH